MGAMLEICGHIKRSQVANTVAWVNPMAYSAGAVIALSCREIVVCRSGTMGDAAPIQVAPGGVVIPLPDTERQKALAPLLAEVVESARLNGYDDRLVQSFIMLGVELWMVRDTRTGEVYFIDETEYRNVFGAEPARGTPLVLSGAPPVPAGPQPGTPASPATSSGPSGPTEFVPAAPGMDPEVVREISDALAFSNVPAKRPRFDSTWASHLEVLHYATDGKTLLTLKEDQLRYFGLAAETINTDEELTRFFGATNIARLDQTWSESVFGFMTMGASGMIIRGALIVLFLLAMFIELSAPGIGVGGVVALGALLGLIVPPMLLGASNWWAIAAIFSGIGLILVEILLLPGFGFPGALGLLLLLGGLVGTFARAGQMFPGVGPGGKGELAGAVSVVLLSLFAAGVGMYLFSRYTNKIPLLGKLVLADVPRGESMLGAMASEAPANAAVRVGDVGVTTTPLRPSGTAEFADRLVDVVSETGFIEAGKRVRVVSATEYRVSVEAVRGGVA